MTARIRATPLAGEAAFACASASALHEVGMPVSAIHPDQQDAITRGPVLGAMLRF